jgi:hypothetical protein
VEVTLAGSGRKVVRDVTPHLGFECVVSGSLLTGWSDGIKKARAILAPLHEFTTTRSAR